MITVRPAEYADLPAILEIYNEAVQNTTSTADYAPHTLEQRTRWFEERTQNGYPVFVATEATGRVVGWSSLNPWKERLGYRFTSENSVYVAADRRGQGIGRLLLPPLITAARERGLHSILAGIDGTNTASLRLHLAFGFVQVAHFRQTVFKFGQWCDVIYLQLLLEETPSGEEK